MREIIALVLLLFAGCPVTQPEPAEDEPLDQCVDACLANDDDFDSFPTEPRCRALCEETEWNTFPPPPAALEI